MKPRNIAICLTILLVTLAAASVSADRSNVRLVGVMQQYFDLLANDNLEVAGDMWMPEALERSGRFGISYPGVALKVDAVSPLIQHLEEKQSSPILPVKSYEQLTSEEAGTWYKMEYSEIFGAELERHHYYAQERGDWFWLGYPQDFYAAGWPVVETEYLRIHVHPDVENFLNGAVLAATDRFIRAMADTLELDSDKLDEMADLKIEYFYLPSESMFQEITGYRGKGMLDLASNDIISSTFPHFHEMTHLLVNIRLGEVPVYTLPLFREGLAVRYGGRWGKKASALLDLAVFLHREEFVVLDSLLTMDGFNSGATADLVYPLAGLFSAFVIDERGLDDYFEAYRQLSGPNDSLRALTREQVQTVICETCSFDSWDDARERFEKYMNNRLSDHIGAQPGQLKNGKALFATDNVRVTADDDWRGFVFSYDTTMRAPSGNFLFARDDGLDGKLSSMFEAHYEGVEDFSGYRYGVRFDKNEAGLYDYVTNELLAKYVWGITPSDEYHDSTAHTISLRLRKSLLEKDRLPNDNDYRFLPW